jgi:hypothetical protein
VRLRRWATVVANWALVAVSVAGCSATTRGHGTPAPQPVHALPARGVLVSIRDFPIYKAPVYGFRAVASFVVTADGRAVRALPGTGSTAMPRFRSARLDRQTVRHLIDRAGQLGLLGDPLDFGTLAVSEPTGTTVAFTVDGRTVQQTEITVGIGSDTFLSAVEQDRRMRLQEFRSYAESFVTDRAAAYRAPTVAVRRTANRTPRAGSTAVWPLPAADLPSVDGCRIYSGRAAQRIQAVAESAYVEAGWTVGTLQTSLFFRPVLPGSTGCS